MGADQPLPTQSVSNGHTSRPNGRGKAELIVCQSAPTAIQSAAPCPRSSLCRPHGVPIKLFC
jgi:hypothetical protein